MDKVIAQKQKRFSWRFIFSLVFVTTVFFYFSTKLDWVLEFTTAHALLTGQSIRESNFTSFVFPLPAGELWVEQGRTYLSYPLLTFLLAAGVSLISINLPLVVSFLGLAQLAYILYILYRMVKLHRKFAPNPFNGLLIFPVLIILSPGNFYFFTHIFYGDIFAITLCFAFVHAFMTPSYRARMALLFVVSFIGSLSEFLFCFFCVSFLILTHLVKMRVSTNIGFPLGMREKFVVSLSLLTGLTTNLLVYQKDIGFSRLLDILSERRKDRGATEDPALVLNMAKGFMNWNLGHGMLIFCLALLLVLLVLISAQTYLRSNRLPTSIKLFQDFSLLSIFTGALLLASIFHTILFQNLFINHFFLIAKFIIVFALTLSLCAINFSYAFSHVFHSLQGRERVRFVAFTFIFVAAISINYVYSNQYKVAFNFAKDPVNINAKSLGRFVADSNLETICLSKTSFEIMPEYQRQVLMFPPLHYYSGGKQFYWSDDTSACISITSTTPVGSFKFGVVKN